MGWKVVGSWTLFFSFHSISLSCSEVLPSFWIKDLPISSRVSDPVLRLEEEILKMEGCVLSLFSFTLWEWLQLSSLFAEVILAWMTWYWFCHEGCWMYWILTKSNRFQGDLNDEVLVEEAQGVLKLDLPFPLLYQPLFLNFLNGRLRFSADSVSTTEWTWIKYRFTVDISIDAASRCSAT